MTTERFTLHGRLAPGAFAPWIERHAARIGVSVRFGPRAATRITFAATGAPDLLDALEMGCLLGPREVWVELIDRMPA
ncbi:acylphosphatase [Paenirhodobacter sp.]|uniref:acylphosphatase n=1 Tax=Paenirhodobacter sp. TaxID=1965326 RepID=UPI003B3F636B